jgi:uncharacterized protein YbjT (DUF2867 family)
MPELILVTGGTGNLGSKVVRRLQERGCRVRVLSRKERPSQTGVEYVVGNLGKGTGLDQALVGVDVIVHCASATKGDVEATRNLVNAAKALKIPPHLIYISIVGVNGVSFGYFQDKLKAEKIVIDSGLPWTLQRATQFYDFVLGGAKGLTRFPIVPVPKDFKVQAIDVREVADKLVELALSPPAGRVQEMGGPEISTRADMIRQYLRVTHRRRLVVPFVMPGTKAIRAGGLLLSEQPGGQEQRAGRLTWEQFVAQTQVKDTLC